MRLAAHETAQLRAGANTVWVVVIAMAAAAALGFSAAGLFIDFHGALYLLAPVSGCLAIAWFYRGIRPDPWIANGAEAVAQVMLVLILGTLLSYAAAGAAFPYRDAELQAADRALGLDWRAGLDFINRHRPLGILSNLVYFSMKPQTALIVGALVVTGRFSRLHAFALATAFALVITIALFAFMPALGYFAHLGLSAADSPHFSPSVTYRHVVQLDAIRSGAMRIIRFDSLEGIITFPSFHAAAAVLATWALWPCRGLRVGVAALNAAMVAATPFDGAHYFVDLPAGILVASIAIWSASRLHAHVMIRVDPPWRPVVAVEPAATGRGMMEPAVLAPPRCHG